MLRGSRDFSSLDEYTCFIKKVVDRRNRLVQEKLEQERPHLQLLPPAPVPEYQPPGPGAQVEHHPGGWPHLHRSLTAHRQGCRSGCTPGTWKCTTRATWWNGWNACAASARQGSITATWLPSAQARGLLQVQQMRPSAWPTMRSGNGGANAPTWSTCASCTWQRPPWSARWTAPWPCCWRRADPSTTLGQGAGQAHAVAGAGTQPARSTGPEGL